MKNQLEKNSREKFQDVPYTDLNLYLDHRLFDSLAAVMDDELREYFPLRTRATTKDQATIAVRSILANLLRANWAGPSVISISLNKNNYSPVSHDNIGHAAIVAALDFLCSPQDLAGEKIDPLVIKHIGFRAPDGYKENTKLELNSSALERWLELSCLSSPEADMSIKQFIEEGECDDWELMSNNQYNEERREITPITNTLKPRFLNRKEKFPICIKNDEGRSIDYERTPETDAMGIAVNQYNDFLSEHKLSLFLSDDEVSKLLTDTRAEMAEDDWGKEFSSTLSQVKGWQKNRVYRVFNRSSLEFGGRHYGGFWQNLPKRYRSFITIDGHPTVELDYASLHPSMIYHQRGLVPKGDPYRIEGLSDGYRGAVKLVFLVLINAAPSARRLVSLDEIELPNGWTVPRLIDAIKAKHQDVSDAFRSDLGICLQRLDSDTGASRVLRGDTHPTVRYYAARHYSSVWGPLFFGSSGSFFRFDAGLCPNPNRCVKACYEFVGWGGKQLLCKPRPHSSAVSAHNWFV